MSSHRVFGFGDSLLDTGNLWIQSNGKFPAASTYPEHRYTNAGSIGDYLAIQCQRHLVNSETLKTLDSVLSKRPLINFSVGGATAESTGVQNTQGNFSGLSQMIDKYELLAGQSKPESRLQPCDLVILEMGNNDLTLISQLTSQAEQQASIDLFGIKMAAAVQRLYNLGMRRLALFDLGPAQLTPRALALTLAQQAEIAALVVAMNASLNTRILALSQELVDLQILRIPFNNISSTILFRPAEFGLTNTTEAFISSQAYRGHISAHDVAGYAFWDQEHPTSAGFAALVPFLVKYICPEPPQAVPGVIPHLIGWESPGLWKGCLAVCL